MSALWRAFWVPFLLISTKVYATLSAPLATKSAVYAPTGSENIRERSKVNNYFLHDPYGPDTYAFGYEVVDPDTDNVQFRDERRYVNGSVEGSYGYVRPDGLIEVTRYRADDVMGYLSQTQTYSPGDKRAEAIWPTRRPDIIAKRPDGLGIKPNNVTWDAKSHLNVSVSDVADDVADKLKQEHGLDLNHIDVEQGVLEPDVLNIINGKTPLKNDPNGDLAFQTVHDFIPPDFPIVPFELPQAETSQRIPTEEHKEKEQKAKEENENGQRESTYDKAKTNNAEKAPQLPRTTAPPQATNPTLLPPKPLISSSSANSLDADQPEPNWYERIIQANRREFLEHLPNLS
ncbi:uncharacterized protein LOC115622776 [Scaptodrosophila lebanonensis]|uniref:Uncharacterized protein LOC115622776 n=1 Tax=Drosophila lebanonensis TaxID=7225 RepID=A0A6J2T9J6_DROLE|nr:uncharacterized protein LOC115622776 [Scaptodrosophila lebanonensis]